tara:strand:- start:760 stop:1101 length:342 start_codon:yes stop_codon:yes gene_type:complete
MKKSKIIYRKNPLSFGDWLLLHIEHDTPIGDLARDAQCDPKFFPSICSTKKMKEIVKSRGSVSLAALQTLEDAILTYKKYKLAVKENLIDYKAYENNLTFYGYKCEEIAHTTD